MTSIIDTNIAVAMTHCTDAGTCGLGLLVCRQFSAIVVAADVPTDP